MVAQDGLELRDLVDERGLGTRGGAEEGELGARVMHAMGLEVAHDALVTDPRQERLGAARVDEYGFDEVCHRGVAGTALCLHERVQALDLAVLVHDASDDVHGAVIHRTARSALVMRKRA
jgi:hypothetical protein